MQKRRTALIVVAALLLCSALAYLVWRPRAAPTESASQAPTASAPAAASTPVETPAPVESANAEVTSEDAGGVGDNAASGKTATGSAKPGKADDKSAPAAESASPKASATAAFDVPDAGMSADAAAAVLAANQEKPAKPANGTLSADFHNRVGVTFRLVGVSCTLDGAAVCNKSGKLGQDFSLFSQNVPVGTHRVSIVASYQGASGGVFSYAEGYRFNVQNGTKVALNADQAARVNVMVRESGGPTTPMEQRLRMGMSVK